MKLTKNQFEVLSVLERTPGITQRSLAGQVGRSIGTVNKILTELRQGGLISEAALTQAGYAALEPYRVKRAVFIAAGFGSRLVPITLNTPKPLVRVNGVRMIDTLLDAVAAAGIEEIYIVRGYLGEQFDQLLYKYPNIRFLENPLYNEANNISSALCARHLLQNAYVFEADLYLYNPALITKYQYQSNYLGVKVDKTDDWCFQTSGGIITRLQIGGTDCCHMYGISYWNEEDGARLADHIKEVYEMPGGKERYWDQVPLEYHLGDYRVAIRECAATDIIEIDTYRELKRLDPAYKEG